MGDWLFHFFASYQGGRSNFLCLFYDICYLQIALVTYGEPTPGNYYMHDVVPPKGAFLGSSWQNAIQDQVFSTGWISFALYLLCFEKVFAIFLGLNLLDVEYW